MMGGTIDWIAMPVIVEMLGIDDVELLVTRLVTIKEYKGRG